MSPVTHIANIAYDKESFDISLTDNEIDDWIELCALRKHFDNPDVQLYYVSRTNENPTRGHAFVIDKKCNCQKVIQRDITINIKESKQ